MRGAIAVLVCLTFASAVWAAPDSSKPALTKPLAVVSSEPSKADIDAVAACVAAAGDSPRACIGRIEHPCQDTDAGQTTGGAMMCAEREAAIWELRAKDSATAIAAKLPAERLKLFGEEEAAWQSYRNAACAYEASIYLGGTLAKVVYADCLVRENALRAIDLDDEFKTIVAGGNE